MGEFGGTDRYAIEQRLGAGGFGTVYRAYDRKRNERVALKLLRNVAGDSLYRFKREFRSLAEVTHPNLVALHQLASEGERWFFTMELVEGTDFLHYVRGDSARSPKETATTAPIRRAALGPGQDQPPSADERSFDESRLRSVLRQLIEGVCAVHQAGKLHRDIKPSNVLVTRKGRVVLLDFGLVTELGQDRSTDDQLVVGTAAYMAPEQAKGGPVTEAADWYSVGVMLYESLTGHLPHQGEPLQMVFDKQTREPAPPQQLVPGVPEDLNEACTRLLYRAPERRPGGREVLDLLGDPRPMGLAPSGDEHRTHFVGRTEELTSLRSAYDMTLDGRLVVVRVHGASGMGKTVLVQHFLAGLSGATDTVILSGRCYERESMPYKAVDSLIDGLCRYLRRLPSAQVNALLPRDVRALARLFPVLDRVESIAAAPALRIDESDPQALRRRGFEALRELLARITDRQPMVLFIDDLQWAGLDSVSLLASVLRPPDPPALLLVVAYRGDSIAAGSSLFTLGAEESRVQEIEVGRLPSEDAQTLAEKLLRGDTRPRVTATIAEESEGNPLFIGELARHLRRVERTPGAPGDGVTLQTVLRARIAALSAPERSLLEMVAIAGHPIDEAAAAEASELHADRIQLINALRTQHLVRGPSSGGADRVELYHDSIREAVLAGLEPPRRRLLHGRLAGAMERFRADPELLAVHFSHAGAHDKARVYALTAAEQASRSLAFERAVELYRLALELAEHEAARPLQIRLAQALADAGRAAEAADLFLASREGADAEEVLDLQRRAGEQLLLICNVDPALEVYQPVLDAVGLQLPVTPRRALLGAIVGRTKLGFRGLRYSERPESEVPEQTLKRIDACWAMVRGLAYVDIWAWALFSTKHLTLALEAGEQIRILRGLAVEVSILLGGDLIWRERRATDALEVMKRLAQRIGTPYAEALGSFIGPMHMAFHQGRFEETLRLADCARAMLQEHCPTSTFEEDIITFTACDCLIMMGRYRELGRRVPAILEDARTRSRRRAEGFARYSRAWLELAADDPERAREQAKEVSRDWPNDGYHSVHWLSLLGEVNALLYQGDASGAYARFEEDWPALARSGLMWPDAIGQKTHYLRARAALALASRVSDDARRSELLRVAAKMARRIEGSPYWTRVLAPLLHAGRDLLAGDGERAIAGLEAAESGLSAAGMHQYASAAKRHRGLLIGAADGNNLVECADAEMAAMGIKTPARFAAMLAPGPAHRVSPGIVSSSTSW